MDTSDDVLELNRSSSRHDRSFLSSRHDKSVSTIQYPEDENVERGNWSGRFDFILSLLGYAVGLGNVWRFPYLCYRNGGGAFLIPYAVMLIFVGIPLFYMELAIGQFSGSGPLTCWDFAPLFKGIGIAQLVVNSLVGIYYNMIIAWSLFYLVASFVHITDLPWSNCDNEWNTNLCYERLREIPCNASNMIQYSNGTCYNSTGFLEGLWNKEMFSNTTGLKRVSASEEYYNRRVLRLSSGIDVVGPVMWDLALSLLLAWTISFLCMIKGIKTTGKVVYVTAIFPYLVLFILFGRGVSLPHAVDGIIFYLKPDFSRLSDAGVWNDAALQIFFSMSNCWGGLIALASYNKFHNNFERDTIIVTLANFFTGIFAGFVVFGFLGFMAHSMNTSIDDVIDTGPGLAFVVYPDAVARMPVSALWAILFFLMLLTLGLDSEFAGLEAILTSILDQFVVLRPYKTVVIFLMCVFFFLLGLPLCTTSGNYWLQLMDNYSSGWGLLTIALLESIAVAWVYGCDRLYEDIRIMIGHRPSIWWRVNLQFITPAFIIFLLVFNLVDYQRTTYGNYAYPIWADVTGWFMSFFVVMWIPVYAIYRLCKEYEGSFLQRLKNLTLPSVYWGPAVVKYRMLVNYVDGFQVDPWASQNLLPNPAAATPQDSDDNGRATSANQRPTMRSFGGNGMSHPSLAELLANQSETSPEQKPSFSFESAV